MHWRSAPGAGPAADPLRTPDNSARQSAGLREWDRRRLLRLLAASNQSITERVRWKIEPLFSVAQLGNVPSQGAICQLPVRLILK